MAQQPDWEAEYAYTTGMQAFIYGIPYMYNAKLRHDWVTSKRDPRSSRTPRWTISGTPRA